jgi:hypothetical protein
VRLLASLVLVSACGVDPHRVPAFPPYAPDAARVDAGPALAMVVASADCDTAAIAAIATARPALVVIAGSGERSTTARWETLYDRWAPVRLAGARFLAVPGDGDRRGDPRLVGFGAAVGALGGDPWGSVDVAIDDRVWRFVQLDADAPDDELYWLPAVVGGDDFDLLVVSEGAGDNADALREIIDTHRGGMRLVLRIEASARGISLPNGQWGEAAVGGAEGYWTVSIGRDALAIRGLAMDADWQRSTGWTLTSR